MQVLKAHKGGLKLSYFFQTLLGPRKFTRKREMLFFIYCFFCYHSSVLKFNQFRQKETNISTFSFFSLNLRTGFANLSSKNSNQAVVITGSESFTLLQRILAHTPQGFEHEWSVLDCAKTSQFRFRFGTLTQALQNPNFVSWETFRGRLVLDHYSAV